MPIDTAIIRARFGGGLNIDRIVGDAPFRPFPNCCRRISMTAGLSRRRREHDGGRRRAGQGPLSAGRSVELH